MGRAAGAMRTHDGCIVLFHPVPPVTYAPLMRTRIAHSLALLSTLGLLLLTLVAASPVLAQGNADCSLAVKPSHGAPGTQFAFSGSGYAPTRIVLKRAGGPTKTVPVTPGDSADLTVRLVAGQGDTGTWKATAIEPGGCSASVSFTVGLPSTSTVAGPDDGMRGAALAGFAALGGMFVLASVVILPRVTRNARSR